MKILRLFVSVVCFYWISFPAFAQKPMINLYEIHGAGRNKLEIPPDEMAIVDIQANISLELRVDTIETEILRFYGVSDDDSRLKKLQNLNRLLEREVAIANYLNAGFDKNSASIEEQHAYFQGLYAAGGDLLIDLKSSDSTLYIELNSPKELKAYYAQKGTYFEFVLAFLNRKADKLRKELLGSLGLSEGDSSMQVYFRLGAFLRDKNGGRPIHVENFDEFDKENYREIERFGKPISDKEQKALKENARLNNELGGEIKQSVDYFKGVASSYKKELVSFKYKFSKLDSFYKSSVAKLREAPKTLPAAVVLMDNSPGLNQVEVLYTTLYDQYSELASVFSPEMAYGEKINNTLDLMGKIVSNGVEQFDKDVEKYTLSSEATKSGKEVLGIVSEQYNTYVQAVQKDISGIRAFIQKLRDTIRPFRKAYLENEEFSEKVNRFQIGNVPATGFIELNYIGAVKPGDEILIKATLERGEDRDHPNFEQKEIFRKILKIRRIKPYIKMSGSIIMANPYTRENIPAIDLENTFQFAPTYGIIMKWGSRKSSFYNNFVDFGVGLAFSSPDFNTDGTPEFGAGIMVSAFKDILSAGLSWNFGMDAPYSFIGFNIPFSIGGLPSDNSGRFGQ